MIRAIAFIFVFSQASFAHAEVKEINFQLYFKAFCRNEAKEVEIKEIDQPIVYRFDEQKPEAQVFHPLLSAGYEVYVSLEILREPNAKNYLIRLTPWRKVNDQRDISYGTAFLEQSQPAPLANLGVAVHEEIDESTGSYCTLTATIASK